jgi:gliding motility-associated-like protein
MVLSSTPICLIQLEKTMRSTFINKITLVITLFHLSLMLTASPGIKTPSIPSTGFIENKGQLINSDKELIPSVFFKGEIPGMDLYISEKGISYVLKKNATPAKEEETVFPKKNIQNNQRLFRIDADFIGASIKRKNIDCIGVNDATHYNYFYSHCSKGIYDVKEYQKIRIREIYPKINLVLYLNDKGFKYDFEVGTDADLTVIKIAYQGAEQIKKLDNGNLQIFTPLGIIEEHRPISFQNNTTLRSDFLINKNVVSFDVKDYNPTEPLVIDPQLVWGTLYGGSSDDLFTAVTTDNSGNIFVTGQTNSGNFPVRYGLTYFDGTLNGGKDAFFIKFNNTGKLLWATYYGGKADDGGKAISIDPSGNLFATGYTNSDNFPLQNSGTYHDSIFEGETDAFILKFTNTGERLWGTYYGGSQTPISDGIDEGESIVTDYNGNVFITGHAHTANFPVKNAGTYFDDKLGGDSDGFILKFDNAGNLLWSTYYGGSGSEESASIACDKKGNIYITGYTLSYNFPVQSANTYFDDLPNGSWDAFILKFDNNGNRLWATLYGGSGVEICGSIAVDQNDNLLVLGSTESSNFPLMDAETYFDNSLGGKSDVFILKFDNLGNRLWATYYGGSDREISTLNSYSLTSDLCGNIFAGFQTHSGNIPTLDPGCENYYDDTPGGNGGNDCFITKFTNAGNLLWASYIGDINSETGVAMATDQQNNLFACGAFGNFSPSTNLPLVNPGNGAYFNNTAGGNSNAFILKFTPVPVKIEISSSSNKSCCLASAGVTVSCSAGPVHYLWNTGQVSQVIDSLCAGNYSVIVSTYECMEDTTLLNVKIPIQDCNPDVPNIFTPNNDGVNDTFTIKDLEGFPGSSLEVYDRWGKKVYENANYQNDWNGTNWKNSNPLSDGIYYYIFHRSDNIVTTGFISILH